MKKLMLSFALIASSFGANAINLNIHRPVNADRLGISGSVTFVADCAMKSIKVTESDSVFYTKNIIRNAKVICYGDDRKYVITMFYGKGPGAWHERNMLSTDPGRYNYTPVVFSAK